MNCSDMTKADLEKSMIRDLNKNLDLLITCCGKIQDGRIIVGFRVTSDAAI